MRPHSEKVPLVALIARSFFGDELYFRPWLASIEMYWPYQKWPVVVVMDESPKDRDVASNFPTWVMTYFEPLPRSAQLWPKTIMPGRKMKSTTAYMQVNWSQWNFDKYTNAEFIALTDIDAVFHTWVTEEMLFVDRKPRLCGHCPKTDKEWEKVQGYQHKVAVGAANLEYVAEFMFYLPLLVRRTDLAAARRWLVAKRQSGIGRGFDFEAWFIEHASLTLFHDNLSSPSMNNILGHWLWTERRENVSFHIEPSFEDGRIITCAPFDKLLGVETFSPVFHPATHLAMVKNIGWKAYANTAHTVIWSGWCGAGAQGSNLNFAAKCLERPFGVLIRLCGGGLTEDTARVLMDHLKIMLVSAPYWPSAWERFGQKLRPGDSHVLGLSDAWGLYNWLERSLHHGGERIRELTASCAQVSQRGGKALTSTMSA